MTRTQHPITPPAELVQEWDDQGTKLFRPEYQLHLCARAAQWGADQELEACCQWIRRNCDLRADGTPLDYDLRAARRPKPPSLKEQALDQLRALNQEGVLDRDTYLIRRALEQLHD
jgi:hypothetical protein